MEYRILGPLEVAAQDRPIVLGGGRQRAVLALLLLHANEVVSTEQLLDELWVDGPPATATKVVQLYVSRLRKSLDGDSRLVTQRPGYVLRLGPDELDATRFERLSDEGRRALAAGDAERAADTGRAALALWRGPALADFAYEPFAQTAIARLEDRRLAALEDRIEADLELGGHAELVGELEALVAEHPLREHLRAQLMLALYRADRQADALTAYQDARRTLVDELGIEPGPRLQEIERAVLNQDPALAAPATAVRVASVPEDSRRVVTVLSVRVHKPGDNALDPEALRRLLQLCVETIRPIAERGGGIVEATPGGVRVVFGAKQAHEDDALRAARSAVEAREMATGLGAPLLFGIATGEAATEGDESQLVGEVVGAADDRARRAAPGEILVDGPTRGLVAGEVELVPLRNGAGESWNVTGLALPHAGLDRLRETPFVGRERELAQLRQAFERSAERRSIGLMTVFGEAGIGKSRLAEELAAAVAGEATVLSGRCLAYGEGITLWPLAEIVRQAAGNEVERGLAGLLRGEEHGERIATRVAAAIGLADTVPPQEEIFLAFRQLFEALARARPLVLVLEDLHWAEPTLLDLVDYVGEVCRSAPILVLCLARPELLEARPGWGGGKLNAGSLLLEPLQREESEALVHSVGAEKHLAPETCTLVLDRAEGNPLFLEQLLALVAKDGRADGDPPIPPTIRALLAARLDRLGPGERAVLERAAVVGKEFHLEAVIELLPSEARPTATRHLETLVRRNLLRAPDGDLSRFRHVLVRDAAYRGISKARRAELHGRYATWLEHTVGEAAIEVEEILGYHLEQSHRYHSELGAPDDGTAARAAVHLASAGRRALTRSDIPAAINLLERALALPHHDSSRLALLPDLGKALFMAGEVERSASLLTEAIDRARVTGDRGVEWRAIVQLTRGRLYTEVDRQPADELVDVGNEAVRVFEELADDVGLARSWILLADAHALAGKVGQSVEAARQAGEYADRAGSSEREEAWDLEKWMLVFGPTPVSEAIRRWERLPNGAAGNLHAEFIQVANLAAQKAALGEFAGHREERARVNKAAAGIRLTWLWGWSSCIDAYIERLAGDLQAAEGHLRHAIRMSDAYGDRWLSACANVALGRVLYDQGRYEEAGHTLDAFEPVGYPTDDACCQYQGLGLRAKLVARRGESKEADELGRRLAALPDTTDYLVYRAEIYGDLAEIARLAGRTDEAAEHLERALRLWEEKGNVVMQERIRALLDELSPAVEPDRRPRAAATAP